MSRSFTRIVAVLLIPALIEDPAPAAALSSPPSPTRLERESGSFAEQALAQPTVSNPHGHALIDAVHEVESLKISLSRNHKIASPKRKAINNKTLKALKRVLQKTLLAGYMLKQVSTVLKIPASTLSNIIHGRARASSALVDKVIRGLLKLYKIPRLRPLSTVSPSRSIGGKDAAALRKELALAKKARIIVNVAAEIGTDKRNLYSILHGRRNASPRRAAEIRSVLSRLLPSSIAMDSKAQNSPNSIGSWMAIAALMIFALQGVLSLEEAHSIFRQLIIVTWVVHELIGHGVYASWRKDRLKSVLLDLLWMRGPAPTHANPNHYRLAPMLSMLAGLFMMGFSFPSGFLFSIPGLWVFLTGVIDALPFIPGTDGWFAKQIRAHSYKTPTSPFQRPPWRIVQSLLGLLALTYLGLPSLSRNFSPEMLFWLGLGGLGLLVLALVVILFPAWRPWLAAENAHHRNWRWSGFWISVIALDLGILGNIVDVLVYSYDFLRYSLLSLETEKLYRTADHVLHALAAAWAGVVLQAAAYWPEGGQTLLHIFRRMLLRYRLRQVEPHRMPPDAAIAIYGVIDYAHTATPFAELQPKWDAAMADLYNALADPQIRKSKHGKDLEKLVKLLKTSSVLEMMSHRSLEIAA